MFSRTLRRAAVAAALALPLVAAACTSPTGVRPEHRAALLRARAQWAALGADSYTFVVGPRCYCGVQEIRTTVVDGVATERVYVETGSPVPANLFHTLETVDAMLAHIEKAIDDEVAELDTAYDERGVPIEVQIDYTENAIDEEFGWVIKSLTLTP